MKEATGLLDETLTEEKDTDEALTQLAEDMANPKARKTMMSRDGALTAQPARRGASPPSFGRKSTGTKSIGRNSHPAVRTTFIHPAEEPLAVRPVG
jgi:hypothetical protein